MDWTNRTDTRYNRQSNRETDRDRTDTDRPGRTVDIGSADQTDRQTDRQPDGQTEGERVGRKE